MRTATDLCDRLYGGSPFEGFDHTAYPHDLQGWLGQMSVVEQVLDQVQPRLIVEIGSWKGASAVHMLQWSERYGGASVICVDTWLGSPEHWLNVEWKPLLGLRHGRPTLYEQFLANIIHLGLQDRVVPLPLASCQAATVLGNLNVRPTFIYLDGAHDEKSVREDLEAWWPLLQPGGVIVGDDFTSPFPGLVAAVRAFWQERSAEIAASGCGDTKWYAQKGR